MKFIVITSLLGLIPFYIPELDFYDKVIFNEQHIQIYGFMIVSFLFGMQWQRITFEQNFNFFQKSIPILPIFLSLILFFFQANINKILIFLFLIALFIDCVIHKKLLNKNYLILRIIVTLLVVVPFFIKIN
tara:strand:+ start:426 stop:818 length:393 start_codon:yes stop_codon:yes gene_type:complete